jgi:thiamine-phosphate pyrophosphorylase
MARRLAPLIHGLYGMVDLPGDGTPAQAVALCERLVRGGAGIVQLRMKGAPTRALMGCAQALAARCAELAVALCINDRVDIALLVGAAAVHLGQDDLPLEAAQALAGGRLQIGVSTHSLEQALAAAAGRADYLAFGPVFATGSKLNPDPVQGLKALAAVTAQVAPLPVVAIGGVTPERAVAVARAGARAAATIAGVNAAADPVAAARRVVAAFDH